MNQDNAETQCIPDVDLHFAWAITHGAPPGQRQQNQLLDHLVTVQMQRVNCKNWVVKVKNMLYARTNAGRLKSERDMLSQLPLMIWVDPPIQEQQAVLIRQAPLKQDIGDLTYTHVSDEHGPILEQALLIVQIGQHLTLAEL